MEAGAPSVFPLFAFGHVAYWGELLKNTPVVFEVHESFPKQTYRNRFDVLTAQGVLPLTVPLKGRSSRIKHKDVRIDNGQAWQDHHWKTLEAAYNASPFFFHYKPGLKPLFERRFNSLLSFNKSALEISIALLGIDLRPQFTGSFAPAHLNKKLREGKHFNKQAREIGLPPYPQVFEDRFGFVSNLSILDLLFNEGPQARLYLQDL